MKWGSFLTDADWNFFLFTSAGDEEIHTWWKDAEEVDEDDLEDEEDKEEDEEVAEKKN